VSGFDDRLTKELERAARPAEPTDVFDEIDRRRERRVTVRRVQTAMLATVVFAGSIAGVLVLNRAFRGEGITTPAITSARNGLIVVSFGDDGGTHLYLLDPTDPKWDPSEHRLTNERSKDTRPAISPDGRTIAFQREELDGSSVAAIWTIGIDGTGAHRLTDRSGAWASEPTWSPDERQIAFISTGIDSSWITIVNADGSDPRDIQPSSGSLVTMGDPSWSPDGTTIAAAVHAGAPDGPSIAAFDVASGEQTSVVPMYKDGGSPSWSPDGHRLAYASGGIWMVNINDGKITQLTTSNDPEDAASADLGYSDSQPTWSPDGEWIAFERFFSPSEFFVYAIRPDGTELHRIGLGGDPAWSIALPDSPTPSPTDPAEPTDTQTPSEPSQDIGLAFGLCRLEALDRIAFLGDGANGTAWVGTRLADDGSCPQEYKGDSIVAVDVDGDGRAESWAGPLARCIACRPFAVTDLNADGMQELVVIMQSGSTTEYTLFSLERNSGGEHPQVQQVTVAEPGSLPLFRATKPVSFWAGGDEGFSANVRCEGYPDQPVLVITQTDQPVEAPGPRQVYEARLVFQADGTVAVTGSNQYTEPVTAPTHEFTGRACGVPFWGI
jgi:Tol biopolymer transport system component